MFSPDIAYCCGLQSADVDLWSNSVD